MNYTYLLCEIENKVAVVTISHEPVSGNKLNTQVYQELTSLFGVIRGESRSPCDCSNRGRRRSVCSWC